MRHPARLAVFLVLFMPVMVLAQAGPLNTGTSTKPPQRPGVDKPFPVPGPYIKDAAKERNEAWRNTMDLKKASTTDFIKARHEELKNAFGAERTAILNTIGEKREELKMLFINKRASTTDFIKQRRLLLQDEAKQQRAETLDRYFQKAGEMFQANIDRLSALLDKIAERIEKLEDEKGVDLSAAKALLDEAQAKLQEASAKADEFADQVVQTVEEGQGGVAGEAMKALRQEVGALIKEAHQALVEAIRITKAALGNEPAATTTPTQ